MTAVAQPRTASVGDAVRTLLRGVGQTLITAGVVVLLFCVYELQYTNVYTSQQQEALGDELRRTWSAPAPAAAPAVTPVALGDAFAVLRIPRLGEDHAVVVVEGTSVEDLKKGPGHLAGTALPGQMGNVVLSGHRTTYGAPFSQVDVLQPGDAVVVETRDSWFTYRVTGTEIVAPTAVEVTLPVPKQPGVAPTKSLLTLTTCHPRYSARQRMIVSAVLEAPLPKSEGLPPALTGAA